jgi:5'-methylthioadenosine phosphorylase
MRANIAVIGGTGIDEVVGLGEVTTVDTRFGKADVVEAALNDASFLFVPRHGIDHATPPSLINYRAQIAALKSIGIRRVIGLCAVGSIRRDLMPGSFVVMSDFIDLTKKRTDTFFDEPERGVVHTDFTQPYCPEISMALIEACKKCDVDHFENAVYVGVEGPRYETPTEIRLYGSWGGDVIGMTNVPEVILAREAGLCYGALGVVTNQASGLSPTPLSHEEVRAVVASSSQKLADIMKQTLDMIPKTAQCACQTNTGLIL